MAWFRRKQETAVDPVCGMTVEVGKGSLTASHAGQEVHFCSVACQRRFLAHPSTYEGRLRANTSQAE